MTTLFPTTGSSPEALLDALGDIEVDVQRNRAVVAGQAMRAANRAELRAKLAAALYDRFHVGKIVSTPEPPGLRSRLIAAVPHEFTAVRGRVLSRDSGSETIVEIEGVRVRVTESQIASRTEGEYVSINLGCVRPNLAPDFVLVDGSAGHGLTPAGHTLRVYAHLLDPETAPAAWRAILVFLEEKRVPFRAKISLRVPRRDALVLYLGPEAWPSASDIADSLARQPGLGHAVSAYAHQLSPGVAAAWDPADPRPGYQGLSFGEHRSHALADALLSPGTPADQLAAALAAGNVDPTRIYRNITSPAV
ncbi:T3SS effector HopA1 family protein [Amycolatopsis sp. NPDC003676]